MESTANAILFWKKERETLPNLANFAKKYLVIPGSSAYVERLWSKCKELTNPKRQNLSDETTNALIFLKGHL